MGKLINIDNGGTLTDFCAFDGKRIHHTKSLTTPFDLSKCFFDGLKKLANEIYGDERRVDELLQTTDYIRYSTTQGTNALVEKKGPRLGLIVGEDEDVKLLKQEVSESSFFEYLIGDRVSQININLDDEEAEIDIIRAISSVTTAGANRIVISLNNTEFNFYEKRIKRIIDRKFPTHLLGVVPVLAASDLVDDRNYMRRTWTALVNSFLHPSMEHFLYSADHRLKKYKIRNPLLIFRNDGGAARVAKTMALKTYSSGPRGGMEGVKVIARHYGYKKLLSYDVGGTTTDIGVIADGDIEIEQFGHVEDVEVSIPLPAIHNVGVGGSSIIDTNGNDIKVGPESVGAAPGPACFGLGGKKATITDVFLLMGILDSSTYFGGQLKLDMELAKEVIEKNIAEPLRISLIDALNKMLDAWVNKIAHALNTYCDIDDDTTLMGFGGAGALAATRIADAVGVNRVLIPGKCAVFSAFGIGFSPLSHEYRVTLTGHNSNELEDKLENLRIRASRDMYAEGVDIDDCAIETSILRISGKKNEIFSLENSKNIPCEFSNDDVIVLLYKVRKDIHSHILFEVGKEKLCLAKTKYSRTILNKNGSGLSVPVYEFKDQLPGASAEGPAIIEEEFFTGVVDRGWHFTISGNYDLILEK